MFLKKKSPPFRICLNLATFISLFFHQKEEQYLIISNKDLSCNFVRSFLYNAVSGLHSLESGETEGKERKEENFPQLFEFMMLELS